VTGSIKKPKRPLFVDSAFASVPEATEIEGDQAWDEWARALQDQEAQGAKPPGNPATDPSQPPAGVDPYAPTEPVPLEPSPPAPPPGAPHRKA
jgi:hypothetical protein